MEIKSLLKQTDYESFSGDENALIKGMTNDSRKVTDGDIYVAVDRKSVV